MKKIVFKNVDFFNKKIVLVPKFKNISLCTRNVKVKTRNNPKRKGRVYND